MKTVLVTGASGLVGSRVVTLLKKSFSWLTPNSTELDITNRQNCQQYISNHHFDIFLHLAAYTNVDKAEEEKNLCRQINVDGTTNVFQAVNQKNKPFILISTDFVFDGQAEKYTENSLPNPLSYYGQTKFQAEKVVKDRAMIVRLSYPYGISNGPKPDFVRSIVNLLKKGHKIKAVKDLIFTPTYLDDIAFGLKHLLNHFAPQVYHLVGPESFSPYQAFKSIASVFSLNKALIQSCYYQDYFNNKAPRPKKNRIINQKLALPTHTFEQGLRLVKQEGS